MSNGIDRLRWQCRRGMLELDLLLEAFLEKSYPSLSEREQRDFIRLLDAPDPELMAWIMGDETPDDPAIKELMPILRKTIS